VLVEARGQALTNFFFGAGDTGTLRLDLFLLLLLDGALGWVDRDVSDLNLSFRTLLGVIDFWWFDIAVGQFSFSEDVGLVFRAYFLFTRFNCLIQFLLVFLRCHHFTQLLCCQVCLLVVFNIRLRPPLVQNGVLLLLIFNGFLLTFVEESKVVRILSLSLGVVLTDVWLSAIDFEASTGTWFFRVVFASWRRAVVITDAVFLTVIQFTSVTG